MTTSPRFESVRLRTAAVVSLDGASPPTLSARLPGDPATVIAGIRYIGAYVPAVGDRAVIAVHRTEWVAVGKAG